MTTQTNSLDPRKFTPDLVSRAVGALIGQAVGDALGAFAEFGPAGQFSQRFPSPVLTGTGEMVGGGLLGWAPGEFTDDTQMAVALAESILAFGGKFDPAHTFDRFVAWAKGAHDIGSTTAAALRFGKPWQEAAEAGHDMTGRSGGNGGVMRVAPVGIAGVKWNRIDTLWIAFDQARLTHFDPTVGVGAMVVADLVRSAIIDGALDGFNGTIFAYGQTGSGKTFTMTGGQSSFNDRGIIPRTLQYLFQTFKKRTDCSHQVHISYMEIYNEHGQVPSHPLITPIM